MNEVHKHTDELHPKVVWTRIEHILVGGGWRAAETSFLDYWPTTVYELSMRGGPESLGCQHVTWIFTLFLVSIKALMRP